MSSEILADAPPALHGQAGLRSGSVARLAACDVHWNAGGGAPLADAAGRLHSELLDDAAVAANSGFGGMHSPIERSDGTIAGYSA